MTAVVAPIAAVVACGDDNDAKSVAHPPITLEFDYNFHYLFTVNGHLSERALPVDGQVIRLKVNSNANVLAFTWTKTDAAAPVSVGFLKKTKTQNDMLKYLAQKLSGQASGAKYDSAIKAFQDTVNHHNPDGLV